MSVKITFEDLKKFESQRWGEVKIRVSLKQMAEFINENLPEFEAKMEHWWGSFDRPAGRLRIPGKFRECEELIVYQKSDNHYHTKYVLKHNPLEAYRNNREVARWIIEQMEKKGQDK